MNDKTNNKIDNKSKSAASKSVNQIISFSMIIAFVLCGSMFTTPQAYAANFNAQSSGVTDGSLAGRSGASGKAGYFRTFREFRTNDRFVSGITITKS